MCATKLLLAIFLSLFVTAAIGLRSPELNKAQECRLRKLTASQPSQSIQSEGGQIEFWDQNDAQFQCAGVAAARVTMHPNTVHLPNFHPNPSFIYVLQGYKFTILILSTQYPSPLLFFFFLKGHELLTLARHENNICMQVGDYWD